MKEMYEEIRKRYNLKVWTTKKIVRDFKDGISIERLVQYTVLDRDIVEDIIRRWMVAWEKQ